VTPDLTTLIEQASAASGSGLGPLFDALPDGVVLLQPDGQIAACNPSAERILGLSAAEMAGRTPHDPRWAAIHEDGSPFPGELHPVSVAQKTGQRVDDTLMGVRKPDGTLSWITISAQPLLRPHETVPYAVVATFVDITRRVQAHQEDRALHAQGERDRDRQIAFQAQILRSVQNALVAVDLQGHILYWNTPAETLYGWTAEETRGQSVLSILPPQSVRLAETIIAEVTQGRTWTGEFVCRRKDGSLVTVLNATAPIFDDNGRVVGAVGGSLDASELVANEREVRLLNARLRLRVWRQTSALRASHARFRAISDAAPLGIVLVDDEGHPVYANAAYQKLRERLGEDPLKSAGLRTAGAVSQLGREAVAVEAHGGRVFLSLRAVSMREHGALSGHLVLVEDVTRRRRADEALRESEERYRALFVDSGDAIVLVDPDGRLAEMNPAATVLLGVDPQGPPASAIDFLGPAAAAALYARLEETGTVRDIEIDLRRPDGRIVTCVATASAGRAEDGSLRGYQVVIRDITERRASETALRELSGRILRIQDDERRRIARDLHDSTAQVLTALSLNLALLRRRDGLAGQRAHTILEESHALAAQCAQEIRTASYLLHPPLLDEAGLPAALRWYCDGFQARSGLRVLMQLSPNLGRLPGELETTVFRLVQESLNNIHRHSGSATARIILSRGRQRVKVTVRDAGRGIAEDTLAILNTVPASLGLGVAGMRERVRELGGTLTVLSGPEGTMVRASLPLTPSAGACP
jgi:two-component system, NarL family, sensor kinase